MLRGVKDLFGYKIRATDGEIGYVHDLFFDDDYWTIRYLVVDTGDWLPGRKVLISPPWIEEVRWGDSNVLVNMNKEEVKNSPEYNPSDPINRSYEGRLYDYYGRPKYWTRR